MNQSEWETSSDCKKMLEFAIGPRQYQGSHRVGPPTITDRKLRLFILTCSTTTDPYHSTDVQTLEKMSDQGLRHCASTWTMLIDGGPIRMEILAKRAKILRELFNPFWPRPVKAPGKHIGKRKAWEGARPSWLTNEALGLAEACYDERVLRECQFCHGKGNFQTSGSYAECPRCLGPNGTGTGKIDSGQLDNTRLMILADCLEEAGCPTEETCPHCKGKGRVIIFDSPGLRKWERCDIAYIHQRPAVFCHGSGKVPHPLLVHLRSPGPHYRGMWSLDYILDRK